MKKFWNLLSMVLLGAALCVGFTACGDDDPINDGFVNGGGNDGNDSGTEIMKHTLTLNLLLPETVKVEDVSDLKAFLTNDKEQEQTVAFEAGKTSAQVKVIPGMYNVTVSGKLASDANTSVIGKASVDVFADATVSVELSTMTKSTLIFKSIYSTGGKQGYVTDQYFEIVNNSDEVQYLDQLVLTSPMGNQKAANAWQSNGYTDIYACGQGTVLAFPGSGKDYPLQPGESIVLANDAADHHELAGLDKEGNDNNCPDLTKADWEIYLENVAGDTDYPAPNVEVIFQNNDKMKAWGMGFMGRGYVLARLPQGMTPQQFAADKANIMTTPGTTSDMEFLMVPSKYVLDAVEVWNPKLTEHYGIFLPKDDAMGVDASPSWAGKSVRRKVVKIENGRPYYQDTNNSAADFLTNQPMTPGETPTQVD